MSIITTFVDQTNLTVSEQFNLLEEINHKNISLRNVSEEINDIKELIKNRPIKVINYDSNIKSYDLYNDEVHEQNLHLFEIEVQKAKELKAIHILFEIPKVKDIITECEFLENKVRDYIDVAKKYKIELVIKPTIGIKSNAYVYLLKQFKKTEIGIIYDTIHLYKNDESLLTSYRIIKPYIKVLRVADIRKNIPVLIGYGELKLLEIFKSFLRDKYNGVVELDTNLLELIDKTEKVNFFKKLSKKYKINRNAKDALEDKIGTLELKDIIDNQLQVLEKVFK